MGWLQAGCGACIRVGCGLCVYGWGLTMGGVTVYGGWLGEVMPGGTRWWVGGWVRAERLVGWGRVVWCGGGCPCRCYNAAGGQRSVAGCEGM